MNVLEIKIGNREYANRIEIQDDEHAESIYKIISDTILCGDSLKTQIEGIKYTFKPEEIKAVSLIPSKVFEQERAKHDAIIAREQAQACVAGPVGYRNTILG